MVDYPSTLPVMLLSGNSFEPTDLAVRTQMQSGRKRARRTSMAKHGIVQATFIYTAAQYKIFYDWFYDPAGANAGTAYFNAVVDIDGVIATRTCHFDAVFKMSRVKLSYQVQVPMEVIAYA